MSAPCPRTQRNQAVRVVAVAPHVVTAGDPVIRDDAVDAFGFSGGQAAFEAMAEVSGR
jgi:hypothetical protein